MKRLIKILTLSALVITPLLGCNQNTDKEIVILYTGDVHCGLDEEGKIGYAALEAYKKELEKNNYVTLLDSGDAISGDFVGAISKGEYIIDIMNELEYDFMVIGNHEFDFGMDVLKERFEQFNGDVLACNFQYIGQKENKFEKVKPYKVIKYGKKKVGFVGVTTPESLTASKPSYFMEDGQYAYTFNSDSEKQFYNCVQNYVDACHKQKADYVFLVTHLGADEQYSPFSSIDVMNNITGVDAILDGHAHQELASLVTDKDGNKIPLLDAGYKMSQVGQITIKKDRSIEAKLTGTLTEIDPHMTSFIEDIEAKVDALSSEVMATSDIALKMTDEDGIRMSRNREIPLGNLVADAYRVVGETQIGLVNGGGIRSDLKEGELTFKDIMALHPFGNTMDVVEVAGAQIADFLEFGASKTKRDYYTINEEGKKVPQGENGAFGQVSGLKYSIDTTIPSSIVVDDKGMFVKVDGERRVKDISVLENGTYVPLDNEKTYTVCSHNYLIEEAGDGANMFKNAKMHRKDIMFDYEILVRYIVEVLNGKLKDKYAQTEERIFIY